MHTRFPLGLFAFLSAAFTAHGAPIVISGWLTNVQGDDSPYEYVQLVATLDINFAVTPYTVVWNDVGPVADTVSQGWAGGAVGAEGTYAFQLTTGTVTRGEVFYVGGAGQRLAGPASNSFAEQRWLRVINTSTTSGDGLGSPDTTGVLGNGGPHADGIAIFAGLSASITSTTVPLDSVFFGNLVGNAHPVSGGFKMADNDHYSSNGVFGDAGNAFLFGDLAQNQFEHLSGTYNWSTGQWDVARTADIVSLNNSSTVGAIVSSIALVPEPGIGLSGIAGLLALAARRSRRS